MSTKTLNESTEITPTRDSLRRLDWSDRPIINILLRLKDVRRNNNGWTAQCPAHCDTNPSLSIAVGEHNRVLLHCHAGCFVEDVVAAMDLTLDDLHARLRFGRRGARPPFPEICRCVKLTDPKAKPLQDWSLPLKHFQALLRAEHVQHLSEHLGLPPQAFQEFRLGYSPADHLGPCWTVPEWNVHGTPIGIVRRYRDGRKLCLPESRRGLILPANCLDRQGPIWVPEGFSDVATFTLAGLPTVGRPSAKGGVDLLTELFTTTKRVPVVIGDNDRKPDGSWPGREGAVHVAKVLSERLGLSVPWVMPPESIKDARALYLHGGLAAIYAWCNTFKF